MALLDLENYVSRTIRAILADVPIGASLYDVDMDQPALIKGLFRRFEFFLADVLGEVHREWREESFDGFVPLFTRKVAEREAEMFGRCIIISNQLWAAFYLKIRIAPDNDEVSWLELGVGEKGYFSVGKGRKVEMKPLSTSEFYNRLYAFQDNPEQMDWVYRVTFGDREV